MLLNGLYEATTFDPVDLEELLFPIGDYRFRDYFHPSSGFAAFRESVFPYVPLSCSMSMTVLMNVLNNLLHQLSDEDVVRVSLLEMTFGWRNTLDSQLPMNVSMGHIDMGLHLQTDGYDVVGRVDIWSSDLGSYFFILRGEFSSLYSWVEGSNVGPLGTSKDRGKVKA
uniref:Uncharacterized protein n=1 Tax=Lactuca sativa TaxID=4236 RepID=A0A9R1X7C9_LACSA|nr:hypothetical protein LSAT_V11C700381240 [Lactuca sativa]